MQLHCKASFEVNIASKTIVKAVVDSLPESHTITLSNLDLLAGRFPITYLYFYREPPGQNLTSVTENLKVSLAKTLQYFFPFAGHIVHAASTGETQIICDNRGALLVEAQANISLEQMQLYDISKYLQGKLVHTNIDGDHHLVQVQVTNFTCGCIAITFTFDHALGDATSFGRFLVTWSEIALGKTISCSPDHRRLLPTRFPPSYDDPSLDQTLGTCTMIEALNFPAFSVLLKCLYYVSKSSISRLQELASRNGHRSTKIEAFSAYLWKVMAKSMDKDCYARCKMGWLVDGRRRISRDENLMGNYIGNVLSVTIEEAEATELEESSISEVAKIVRKAINRATNKVHFQNLIDWVELHKPKVILPRIMMGQQGPALVVSSGRRFPVAELDFGFGSPVMGTTCTTIERMGIGYLNQRQSATGDGSWIVSAMLWPELAAAFESDPEQVLLPMSVDYLEILPSSQPGIHNEVAAHTEGNNISPIA